MSEYVYQRARLVAATPEVAGAFFENADAWWRLNPEWEVLACRGDALRVRYERSETEAEWRVVLRTASGCAAIELEGEQPRRIEVAWRPEGAALQLEYRESFDGPLEDARRAELNLWLDAAAGYLALAARRDRRARLARWLLDKIWLRMSPMARRVGLIIVGMEALALLLFIAVVIVYRISG